MKHTDHHGRKYVFDIGTRLIYANGMAPTANQRYPGFGDEGVIIALPTKRHPMTPNVPDVVVQFDRCGTHTNGITSFWPAGSGVAKVGAALARLGGAG